MPDSDGLEGKTFMKITVDVVGVIAGRGDLKEADRQGYVHIVPPVGDLSEFARLERALQSQGINYGKRDIYPAFKTINDLHDALLKIHGAGYRNPNVDDYLIRQGLIQKP